MIGSKQPLTVFVPALRYCETLDALADRGYDSGEQLLACETIGVKPFVPKPRTSNARAAGRFDKEDFDDLPEKDAYRCPAGKLLPFRFMSVHDEQNVRIYFTNECGSCPLKSRCTTGKERRVRRCEHEHVVDATDWKPDQRL